MSKENQSAPSTREKVAWWTEFTGLVVGALGILHHSVTEVIMATVLFVGGEKLKQTAKQKPVRT